MFLYGIDSLESPYKTTFFLLVFPPPNLYVMKSSENMVYLKQGDGN